METTVEQLILERTFASLTREELAAVSELCASEEEFLSMKQFFRELEGVKKELSGEQASPSLKESLDTVFASRHPGLRNEWKAGEQQKTEAPVIVMQRRTWLRVAAAVVVLLGAGTIWMLTQTTQTESFTAQPVAKQEGPAHTTPKKEKTDQQSGTSAQMAAVPEIITPAAPPKAKAVNAPYDEHYRIVVQPKFSDSPDYGYITAATELSEPVAEKTATTALPVPDHFAATRSADEEFQRKMTEEVSAGNMNLNNGFSNAGRMADLHPDGQADFYLIVSSVSLAEQPEGMLDLLTPAF